MASAVVLVEVADIAAALRVSFEGVRPTEGALTFGTDGTL